MVFLYMASGNEKSEPGKHRLAGSYFKTQAELAFNFVDSGHAQEGSCKDMRIGQCLGRAFFEKAKCNYVATTGGFAFPIDTQRHLKNGAYHTSTWSQKNETQGHT
ncbi:MAG: hypothetical protein U1D25_09055 [Hydrogenophaga sp.]|jgi:hypothetical protein|uniref:hypothetical protein n=1 Tax=Hydrogenophaga sp. TaxID=1904254 RepID=UPI00274FACAB|nr:hypothetical protein [Hydrogenophaga sp.]MDP2416421.1 hypothetical protein [Hydrogenophaga sp.]MDZ4188237.1 hypothetical protein [Hydrogenophaga sp.]